MNNLLDKLKSEGKLLNSEYLILLKDVYQKLDNNTEYNYCLSVICHVCSNLPNDPMIQCILNDCIVKSRVFLYNNMLLAKNYNTNLNIWLVDSFSKKFYTNYNSWTVLTKDQKNIIDSFQKYRRLVVSAPTSFWKSKIVDEMIINNDYKNIAIILPTIALLNEVFFRLKNNSAIYQKYTIINSLIWKIGNKNIFILTPEKMDLLLDENKDIKIDFFIMDEIYNIDTKEERWEVFINCLYRLAKQNGDFYLIWPYFESFSKNFLEKFSCKFLKYDTEIVQKDIHEICSLEQGEIYWNFKKNKTIETDLKNLLKTFQDKTIIYFWNKRKIETCAKKFSSYLEKVEFNKELHDYISSNVSDKWILLDCLKKWVAFHHAWIPKHIQVELLQEFNSWTIKYLFCTTTIIEWINTSAKNVVICDNKKWKNYLRWFDIKNIQWRAWRFLSHFIWNIYMLSSAPSDNLDMISFDYFDNISLKEPKLLLIEDEDLKPTYLEKKESFLSKLASLNIPIDLIKRNKYISYEWQISLIKYFRELPDQEVQDFVINNTIPKYDIFVKIFDLIYQHLFSDRYKNDKTFWIWVLKYYVYWYIQSQWKPLIEIIELMRGNNIDTKIRQALKLVTEYFEFALPKYFRAMENIFLFIYNERFWIKPEGNYTYLITLLEYWCLHPHEIILKEIWIPISIIRKITKYISWSENLKEIKEKLSTIDLNKILDPYEVIIINRYL